MTTRAVVEVAPVLAWIPFAVLLAALATVGCATSASFKWVDDVPAGRESFGGYHLAVHDTISVRVWNQESMSVPRARVREDGRITLPFLKDVNVAGMTPNEVGESIQTALVSFIVDPVVTVTLEEQAPLVVSVVGEVTTAGIFNLTRPAGVLHAIAAAGGLNRYASHDSIYVLRKIIPNLAPTRIRFRYADLTSGGTRAANFKLESGDIVVVE